MKFIFSLLAILLLSLIAINAYPVDDNEEPPTDEYDEAEVPILAPPPYYEDDFLEGEFLTDDFEYPPEGNDKDVEEEFNDSGFHHEPGDNRPDGAKILAKRSADSDEYQEEDQIDDEDNFEWSPWEDNSYEWGDFDSNDQSADYDDDGYGEGDYEYEFPSDDEEEEDEFFFDNDAIDDGEFDDEEEVGEDDQGSLLRLMKQTP